MILSSFVFPWSAFIFSPPSFSACSPFLQPSSQPGTWSYLFNESLIFGVIAELGWPWAPDKHIPFAFIFPYLGFKWDLSAKGVSISFKKHTKYLIRLKPWLSGSSASMRACQEILGCLQHCTLALPDGCSCPPFLYYFCSSFKDSQNLFIKYCIPSCCLDDIASWHSQFSTLRCGSKVSLPLDPLSNSIFKDASTSFGIGFLLMEGGSPGNFQRAGWAMIKILAGPGWLQWTWTFALSFMLASTTATLSFTLTIRVL